MVECSRGLDLQSNRCCPRNETIILRNVSLSRLICLIHMVKDSPVDLFSKEAVETSDETAISETFFEYEGGTEKIIFQLALLTLEMHLIASLPPMFLSVKRARNLSFNGLVMEVVQADNRLLNSNFNQ